MLKSPTEVEDKRKSQRYQYPVLTTVEVSGFMKVSFPSSLALRLPLNSRFGLLLPSVGKLISLLFTKAMIYFMAYLDETF